MEHGEIEEDYNERAFGIVKKLDGGKSRVRFYMLRMPKSNYSDEEIRNGEFLKNPILKLSNWHGLEGEYFQIWRSKKLGGQSFRKMYKFVQVKKLNDTTYSVVRYECAFPYQGSFEDQEWKKVSEVKVNV